MGFMNNPSILYQPRLIPLPGNIVSDLKGNAGGSESNDGSNIIEISDRNILMKYKNIKLWSAEQTKLLFTNQNKYKSKFYIVPYRQNII